MMRNGLLALGLAVLAGAWLGPLPDLARDSFAAHMTMHIAVVAIAAPLVALAVTGSAADPVRVLPRLIGPIPASMFELIVVWAWHVPMLHHAARHSSVVFVVEQASFVIAGVLLWIAAVGGERQARRLRAGAGIAALLFTSMHMTLLGALFALANRPLFHQVPRVSVESAIADQQMGGVIMLLVGGAAYLLGGLGLTAVALHPTPGSIAEQESSG